MQHLPKLSLLLLLLITLGGCAEDLALTDCQGIVAAASCPVGSAAQVHGDSLKEESCQNGLLVDADGNTQGLCKEESDCSFVCKPIAECPCGQLITAESVECQECPTACGNETCDPGETSVQGEEGYCPSDCGSSCNPSELRCNGDLRQSCDNGGAWEDLPCPGGVACQGDGLCLVEPTCEDGIQNGDEEGVDCGGSCTECVFEPTCEDGIQNGTETGVDCGDTCPVCPTCSDGILNGAELNVDCGGSCAECSMVRIPRSGSSTTFEMGRPNSDTWGDPTEQPTHSVTISAFDMDLYEVTAAEYDACVSAGVCDQAETGEYFTSGVLGMEDHPINGVNWNDASAYCGWVGKRLSTEAEWELAAKGETQRRYPWGDDCPTSWEIPGCSAAEWSPSTAKSNCGEMYCHDGFPETSPVGLFPTGVSPYGLHDMAGNVWEWTADVYDASYYSSSPSENPSGPSRA